jgi:hypothetical protein
MLAASLPVPPCTVLAREVEYQSGTTTKAVRRLRAGRVCRPPFTVLSRVESATISEF